MKNIDSYIGCKKIKDQLCIQSKECMFKNFMYLSYIKTENKKELNRENNNDC